MSTPLNFAGQSGVMQGDSRTYGYDASTPELAWAYLVCTEEGGTEVNLGAPGQYLQPVTGANSFNVQYTPSKTANNSKYMFFSFGTNDTKGDYAIYSAAGFQVALQYAISYFVANLGWAFADIVLPTINYFPLIETQTGLADRVTAYNEMILNVARTNGTIFLDPYSHFYNLASRDTYFSSDGIHENDAGHRELANFYEAQDYTPQNITISTTGRSINIV